ncbi:MAG TPA: GNAT family N-acetyltransferase [Thermotogota bacterium]|nr:GNAT family N-acetyltransferase [Thermotogota bacterium]HPJ88663.1 GNAT family N-acetyltransferase [Thermotogota bacterium]HPR95799.1 GNAT family N-acetyltransferase [Thermotogota bacterium]
MIRLFKKSDTVSVANLIYNTFKTYNGDAYFQEGAVEKTLENFDTEKKSEDELFDFIGRCDIFFVYEFDGQIAGVVRGYKNKLSSLFVSGDHHGKKIGQKLIQAFEEEVIKRGSDYIELTATLYAVNFYLKQGYEKTSDIIDYDGLKVYPMKKEL